MTEENATNSQPTPAPAAKSSSMKYVLFGGIGLVLVVVVAVGTVLLLGGQTPAEPTGAEAAAASDDGAETAPGEPLTDEQILDSLMAGEEDTGMLAMIQENLAALDYEPTDGELGDAEGMSVEDSLEAVNWLTAEKKRLAEREAKIEEREKDLVRRENEVNRKMLVLEQAESTRTASLARLYDGMDSRAVAKLMANLDDETVVSILPRMKTKNASEVLQLLPPQRAAKLSKQMITIAGK